MAAAVNRPKSLLPKTPAAEEFYTISRYKIFFLGAKNPWLFTQVTFFVGLAGFFYFCIWNLLNFLAVAMIDTYPKVEKIKDLFIELGKKYEIATPMSMIKYMTLTNMIASGVMFLGLIIIWRRKKIGYYFIYGGLAVCLLTPLVFMGVKYIQAETRWFEYSYALILAVMLAIDLKLRPVGKNTP